MTTFEVLIVVFLILVAGFFAMAEFAIVSSRRARLEKLAAKGRTGAAVAIELAGHPVRFLSAIQVGTTLSTIIAGTVSGAILAVKLAELLHQYSGVAPYATPVAIVIVAGATTYLSLVLGELVPKQLALQFPEEIAARLAPALSLLARACVPIIWLLDHSTNFVLGRIGLRTGIQRTVTEEDIHSIIAEGAKLGVIHPIERDMIEGVLELEDAPVRSIMTPRPQVIWIDLEDSRDMILNKIGGCPYAQLLASRGSIDEVVGIVRKQDLLDQVLRGQETNLEQVVRPPLVVPERTSILRALDLFRGTPVNEALVVDEFGSIQGIVTRTDLLEAVAGDLPKVEGDSVAKVIRHDDGSMVLDAATPMDEVLKILRAASPPPGDFVTLGGFALSSFSHLPQPGERFVWGDWDFQVAEVNRSRIGRLIVRPISTASSVKG